MVNLCSFDISFRDEKDKSANFLCYCPKFGVLKLELDSIPQRLESFYVELNSGT